MPPPPMDMVADAGEPRRSMELLREWCDGGGDGVEMETIWMAAALSDGSTEVVATEVATEATLVTEASEGGGVGGGDGVVGVGVVLGDCEGLGSLAGG